VRNIGGVGPYPAPYVTQEEQTATPRIEEPPEPIVDFHDLWVLVVVIELLLIALLVFAGALM